MVLKLVLGILAFVIVTPLINGCGTQGLPEVRFVVADDFSGPLVVVEDESGAVIEEESGVFTVEFPESGVLRVRDDGFLRNPHRMTAYRENNDVIPLYPEGFEVSGLFGSVVTENGKLYGFFYVGTEPQAVLVERDEYFQLLKMEPTGHESE